MVYLHGKSVCSRLLNSYMSLLSSAAKVEIWSYFSASCLGLDASFNICLSLAQAVPHARCNFCRTAQTGSSHFIECAFVILFFNLPVFCSCLCWWGVYLFILTLILTVLLNLRVLLCVTRSLSRWIWFVCLGTAVASSRRASVPTFCHRSARRPFCSNSWLLVCTAAQKDCDLPPVIIGLLQPTDNSSSNTLHLSPWPLGLVGFAASLTFGKRVNGSCPFAVF